jgi:transcription-repair coupling factor (superfamily II helicase)
VQAILESSELGSGFRIAMRDLEIRGAGNLLGAAQSGHIQEVGLTLYSQLLQEAVEEAGENKSNDVSSALTAVNLPRIELPLDARIPDTYIDHMPTRLAIYQRIAKMADREDIPILREELEDRFGPPPQEVDNLLLIADLRALAGMANIESVQHTKDSIVLGLRSPVGGARAPLQQTLGPSAEVGNQQVHLPMRRLGDEWLSRLTRVLERFLIFYDRMASLPN